MTTIAEVRLGLAQAAATTGLSMSPYWMEPIPFPCGRVYRKAADPRFIFTGSKYQHTFGLIVWAGRLSDNAAEQLLDAYCELTGEQSILAAVQNGTNWAVTVDYAEVTLIGPPTARTAGPPTAPIDLITVEFDINVVW